MSDYQFILVDRTELRPRPGALYGAGEGGSTYPRPGSARGRRPSGQGTSVAQNAKYGRDRRGIQAGLDRRDARALVDGGVTQEHIGTVETTSPAAFEPRIPELYSAMQVQAHDRFFRKCPVSLFDKPPAKCLWPAAGPAHSLWLKQKLKRSNGR